MYRYIYMYIYIYIYICRAADFCKPTVTKLHSLLCASGVGAAEAVLPDLGACQCLRCFPAAWRTESTLHRPLKGWAGRGGDQTTSAGHLGSRGLPM